jgi:protein phosphatase methylesterase 1
LLKLHSLTMIDIIEDTALSSLERMPAILADIPETFDSIDAAVKWSMTSSHSHHFPGLPVTKDICTSIASQLSFNPQSNTFSWIANLKAMQPFWGGWFVGLTDSFLAFPESRLLVLAGTDYMDRRMIIAQMQGKFQLAVIRDSGHAIHEDRPDELAELLASLVHKHLKLLNLLRKPK